MSDKCKQIVYSGTWSRGRQCSRTASVDGFCKQHHPYAVKARQKQSALDYRAKLYASPYAQLERMKQQRDELLKLLAWIDKGVTCAISGSIKEAIAKYEVKK